MYGLVSLALSSAPNVGGSTVRVQWWMLARSENVGAWRSVRIYKRFHKHTHKYTLRDSRSSVGIMIAGLLVIILRNIFSCQQGIFTSSSKSPVRVWIPAALLFNGYLASYPDGKTVESWSLPLISYNVILWMSGAVPTLPLMKKRL